MKFNCIKNMTRVLTFCLLRNVMFFHDNNQSWLKNPIVILGSFSAGISVDYN